MPKSPMGVHSLPPESLSYTNSSINRLLLHQILLYVKIIEFLETHQEHALVEDELHLYTNTVEKHDIPDMRIDPFQEHCKKYIKLDSRYKNSNNRQGNNCNKTVRMLRMTFS